MSDAPRDCYPVTTEPPTQEYTLRAMAANYAGGHSWDHLDGEACLKAADEIKALRAGDAYRAAWLDILDLCNRLKEENFQLRHVPQPVSVAHNLSRDELAQIVCDALWGPREIKFRNDEVKEATFRVADAVISRLSGVSICSPEASTFSAIVLKRMDGLIETANKDSAWEMEAVAEMMKATHLLTVAQAGKVPADELDAREVDAEFDRITGLLFDALKQNKALQNALKPFAAVAESDIGQDETDADIFQPMRSGYNRAPLITVGDMRRASQMSSTEQK